MKNIHRFTFQFPVNTRGNRNKIILVDTVTVNAIAYLYQDGTVRTVDIETIHDSEGQEITKWVPFMEFDLNNEIEQAAEAHIKGVLEDVHFELIEQ